MKKTITEALLIFAIAVLIGVSYNSILPKGKQLPWEYKKVIVPDDSLFSTKISEKLPEANIGEIQNVSYEQMLKIVGHPDFFLIDARLEDMYEEAHIGDALNIYPYWEEERYVMALQEVPYEKKIVLYCDGGACDLSHTVAEMLQSLGYEQLFLYEGGWEEWSKKQNIK